MTQEIFTYPTFEAAEYDAHMLAYDNPGKPQRIYKNGEAFAVFAEGETVPAGWMQCGGECRPNFS